jgi:hypothetical protein
VELGQPPVHDRIRQGHHGLGAAVAEAAVGDRGAVPGLLLLPGEQLGLVLLGHLRCEDLEDPPAQHLEVAGTEVGGLLDQVLLGPGAEVGVEVGGEVVECLADHAGLRGGDGSGRVSLCEDRPPLVEALGEPLRDPTGGRVLPGLVRQPRARVPGAVRVGDVSGGRERPRLQRLEPANLPPQPHQQGLLLVRGEERRLRLTHRVQQCPHIVDDPQQRVSERNN